MKVKLCGTLYASSASLSASPFRARYAFLSDDPVGIIRHQSLILVANMRNCKPSLFLWSSVCHTEDYHDHMLLTKSRYLPFQLQMPCQSSGIRVPCAEAVSWRSKLGVFVCLNMWKPWCTISQHSDITNSSSGQLPVLRTSMGVHRLGSWLRLDVTMENIPSGRGQALLFGPITQQKQ